jgi:molybdopterin molybdotransferase
VYRRPTVGILTTGDELRAVDRYEDVRAGRAVPDSNGPMLAAMVRAAGGHPMPLGIARDEPDELRAKLLAGSECDVLLVVGGASMGEADLVKRVLDQLGFELDFWRVRMRPGSPFSFGRLPERARHTPVFGLPGNPGSAFVTFEVFVRPFLLALGGHRRNLRRTLRCRSADPLRVPARLTHFQRVRVTVEDGVPVARLTGSQGSGLVGGLAHAEGLVVVAEEVDLVEAGADVDVMLLDDGPAAGGPVEG